MLEGIIEADKYEITKLPFCDGGEYTFDVLEKLQGFKEIKVPNVLNPYHKAVTGRYLVKDDTAHIVSSEIMRLFPEEDEYKNPLELTDYGMGQLILEAYTRGYRKMNIYLGGTSTACCGMGCAQALGVKIYDDRGVIKDRIISGRDLSKIKNIDFSSVDYSDVCATVIGDGDCRTLTNMRSTIELKVGQSHISNKEQITDTIEKGIYNVVKIIDNLSNRPYSGTGGSVSYGFDSLLHPKYVCGGEYFGKIVDFENAVGHYDIVITGEGRFDNPVMKKAPIVVSLAAGRKEIPVIYVCGGVDKKLEINYTRGGIAEGALNDVLREYGIKKFITCQYFYDQASIPERYTEIIEFYRNNTSKVLKPLLNLALTDIEREAAV